MNWKKAALGLVFLEFAAMTAWVLTQYSYFDFFELIGANSATLLMSFDLVICLTLICVWMVRDARVQGRKALPYVIVAATFGAAGPLLYLLFGRRSDSGAATVS
jgi:hypothetical protein